MSHNIDVPKIAEECLENLNSLHMLLHEFLQGPIQLEKLTTLEQATRLLILNDATSHAVGKLRNALEWVKEIDHGEGQQFAAEGKEEVEQENQGKS